ncbi:MAG TPA: prolyl oligopeptidase family serine peptidase [Gaiellales bacterium]|nr:prolyl oligopeptidase family serine peptidase [Gaiellales bacterium]
MADTDPRPFRPADLGRERQITSFTLSPDGRHVVYSRRDTDASEYRSHLRVAALAGGTSRQLTTHGRESRPSFSPDGSRIVFLSERDGSTRPWVLPSGGGEPSSLPAPDGGAFDASWSPDGRTLLLTGRSGHRRFTTGPADDPTALHVDVLRWRLDGVGVRDQHSAAWIVPARGGRVRRVTDERFDVAAPRWISNTRIGFLADPDRESPLDTFRVFATGLTGRTSEVARLNGSVWAASWSPKGRLAMAGIVQDDNMPWRDPVIVVAGGPRKLTLGAGLDRPVGLTTYSDLIPGEVGPHIVWEDEEHLLAVVTDRGRGQLVRLGLDGGVEWLTSGDVIVCDVQSAAGRIVVLANSGAEPADLFEVRDGSLRRVNRDGSGWYRPFRRQPEQVSSFDDEGIDAWMLRGGRGRRPAVLQIHGGPYASHSPLPWLEMTALASAGISVIWANPAGSVSYGARFASSLHDHWAGPDSRQLLKLLDRLAERGVTAPGRIGLLGLSYGGLETIWLAGRHPRRFRAAVAENPVSDYLIEYAASDYGTVPWMGLPPLPKGAKEYWPASPASRITDFAGPLLLLQAEQDHRCPPVNSELVFAMRKANGRPVEMVRYPNESHVMLINGRPDRRRDRLDRIVGWFERHL